MKLSEYEKQRLVNIARNERKLNELGLCGEFAARKRRVVAVKTLKGEKPSRSSARRRRCLTKTTPVRKSRRLAAQDQGLPVAKLRALPKITRSPINGDIVPEWALSLGNQKGGGGEGAWQWDTGKTHQHLMTGGEHNSRVVTFGCAGYGASVAKARVSQKQGKKLTFEVLCVSEGVGGFSVGIVHKSFHRPFKSIGKHPLAWVYHSSGSFWHNSEEIVEWGKPFTANDVVRVVVAHDGRLRFWLNGVQQGVINLDVSSADRGIIPFLPACQPYMGGCGALV